MKIRISILSLALGFAAPSAYGDVQALYSRKCATCHGDDGSASTPRGKRSGARDYRDAKIQSSFSDEDGLKAIKDGVTKEGRQRMMAYGSRISDAEAKELLAYIRAFKK